MADSTTLGGDGRDDELRDRAFGLILPLVGGSHDCAKAVLARGFELLDTTVQGDCQRLSYDAQYRRNRVAMPRALVLQRLLYQVVEPFERSVEASGCASAFMNTGSLIKHLNRIALWHKPDWALVGALRVLSNLPSKGLASVLAGLDPVLAVSKCDSSFRRTKDAISDRFVERFDQLAQYLWRRGEKRFLDWEIRHLDYPSHWPERPALTAAHVETVRWWMRLLAPWPCRDSSGKAVVSLNKDLESMRRILDPDALEEMLRCRQQPAIAEILTLPLLSAGAGPIEPPPEAPQPKLTGQEAKEVLEAIRAANETRRRVAPSRLYLLVDGREAGTITPDQPRLSITVGHEAETLQLVHRGSDGDIVMATHLVDSWASETVGEWEAAGGDFASSYLDEGGNRFTFAARAGVGDGRPVTDVMVGIDYASSSIRGAPAPLPAAAIGADGEWEQTYGQFGVRLRGYVRAKFAPLAHDAEDVAVRSIHRYVEWADEKKTGPVYPALTTIARHLAVDWMRRRRRETVGGSEDLPDWLGDEMKAPSALSPERLAIVRNFRNFWWNVCLTGSSQPHEALAFALHMGLQYKPADVVKRHAGSSLFALMEDLLEQVTRSGCPPDEFPALCRAFIAKRLEAPVGLSVRTANEFPALAGRPDSPTGATLLRDYFTGGVPAEEVTQWTRAVRRRVIAHALRTGVPAF